MRIVDPDGRDAEAAEIQHQMLPALLMRLLQAQLPVGDLPAAGLVGLGGLVDVVGCRHGGDAGEAGRQHLLIPRLAQFRDALGTVVVAVALVVIVAAAAVVGAAGAAVIVGVAVFARPAARLIDGFLETAAAGSLAGRRWGGPVRLQMVRRRGAGVRRAVLGGCTTSAASLCDHGFGWIAKDPFGGSGEVSTVAVGTCHHHENECSVAFVVGGDKYLRGAVVADMLVPGLKSYDIH